MQSASYNQWTTVRCAELNEIAHAHTAVGGSRRGRRHTTQQINRAYTMLLASHFQGYCRDLHSECVDFLVKSLSLPRSLETLIRAEFLRGRRIDTGNAQPSSLGADYGRLGIDFWGELRKYDPTATAWNGDLELLNEWRNAIAHQDFTSPKLGGTINLNLTQVKKWRRMCQRFARATDEVMRGHLQTLTGASPW